MIEETISSIIDAEKRADRIAKDAFQKGKKIYMDAETESDRIRQEVILEVRDTLRNEISSAEADANELYDKLLADGKKAADKLTAASAGKIDSAADYVVKAIKERYGSR